MYCVSETVVTGRPARLTLTAPPPVSLLNRKSSMSTPITASSKSSVITPTAVCCIAGVTGSNVATGPCESRVQTFCAPMLRVFPDPSTSWINLSPSRSVVDGASSSVNTDRMYFPSRAVTCLPSVTTTTAPVAPISDVLSRTIAVTGVNA